MSSPYIFFGYGTAFWEDGKWLISCLVKGERSQIPVIFPVQEKYKPKTKMKTRCPRSHSIFKKEMPNLPRKTIIHTRSFHCFPLFKALRKGWFFFFGKLISGREVYVCAWTFRPLIEYGAWMWVQLSCRPPTGLSWAWLPEESMERTVEAHRLDWSFW